MTEHYEAPEFSRLIAVEGIAPDKIRTEEVSASPEECADLAQRLELRRLESLSATLSVRRVSGGNAVRINGHLSARVVQACVVTTEPVATDLAETVGRLYVADLPAIEGDEIEMPEDDRVEALPAVVDLGAVMTEALSLALPLYPRREGAEFDGLQVAEPGTDPLTDEAAKPFAGLADLLKKGDETDR